MIESKLRFKFLLSVFILMTFLLGSLGSLAIAISTTDEKLFEAIKEGNFNKVKTLIEKGADVNAVLDRWGTPLLASVVYGRLETAKYLISKGADVNKAADADNEDIRIIVPVQSLPEFRKQQIGIKKGDKGVVFFSVAYGGIPLTPLCMAAYLGNLKMVKILVKAGVKDLTGALIHASTADVAEYLIKHGAKVNGGKTFYTTLYKGHAIPPDELYPIPLLNTARDCNLELVKVLLRNGANIYVKAGQESVAERIICDPSLTILGCPKSYPESYNYKFVEAFLRKGVDSSLLGKCLERASYDGDIKLVSLLLKYGAKPTAKSLEEAVFHGGDTRLVMLLLKHGARLPAKNREKLLFAMLARYGPGGRDLAKDLFYKNAFGQITLTYGPIQVQYPEGHPETFSIKGPISVKINRLIHYLAGSKGIQVTPQTDLFPAFAMWIAQKQESFYPVDSAGAGWWWNNYLVYIDLDDDIPIKALAVASMLNNAVNSGDLKLINEIIEEFIKESLNNSM